MRPVNYLLHNYYTMYMYLNSYTVESMLTVHLRHGDSFNLSSQGPPGSQGPAGPPGFRGEKGVAGFKVSRKSTNCTLQYAHLLWQFNFAQENL
jgi:hypothetical protein